MSNKSMEEFLNLPQVIDETPKEISKETEALDNIDFNQDVEYVKNNIQELINTGSVTLKVLAKFAEDSESPRAFEVVATLIKTMLEANRDYIKLVEPETKEKVEGGNSGNTHNTNNNLFVGNTNDLKRLLKERREENGE